MNKLKEFNPIYNVLLNILFVGLSGAGKSSKSIQFSDDQGLINNIISCFSDDDSVDHSIAQPRKLGEDNQKTVTYGKYKLTEHIYLYDSWGWDGTNYNNGEFLHMLNGSMDENHDHLSTSFLSKSKVQNQINFIIVVSSQSQVLNKPKHISDLKSSILKEAMIRSKNLKFLTFYEEIPILYVVTMVDEIPQIIAMRNQIAMIPDVRDKYSIVEGDPTFQSIKSTIHKHLDNNVKVYPIINNDSTRNQKVTLNMYSCNLLLEEIYRIHCSNNPSTTNGAVSNTKKWDVYDPFKGEDIIEVKPYYK